MVPVKFKNFCKTIYQLELQSEYTGTFDPEIAARDDTIDSFFAFGHPLIEAIIRYCIDNERRDSAASKVAFRVVQNSDYSGFEGIQFNYIITLQGARTYKKIIPIVLNQKGTYNEVLSHIIFSSLTDRDFQTHGKYLPTKAIQILEEKSEKIIDQIAEQEMESFKNRTINDHREIQREATRFFDIRLRHERNELARQEQQLREARLKGQRVVKAFEGQVRKRKNSIRELEQERKEELVKLQNQSDIQLSIDLLNVAFVKIL